MTVILCPTIRIFYAPFVAPFVAIFMSPSSQDPKQSPIHAGTSTWEKVTLARKQLSWLKKRRPCQPFGSADICYRQQ